MNDPTHTSEQFEIKKDPIKLNLSCTVIRCMCKCLF